jgi:glucose-6-phosphate 1-epimerase
MSETVSIAELNHRFGIAGIAQVVAGQAGLPAVRVLGPSAAGEMYLHGGHVTSWRPTGHDEVLFVSTESHWEDSRAIRGGVPVCFPWFADMGPQPDAPMHGLVRTKGWQLDSIVQGPAGVVVSMSIASDETTKRSFAGDYHLTHRVTFGTELRLELIAKNTGTAPFRFTEALHTYFRIGQIEQTSLAGLDGVHYLDKTDAGREKIQQGPVQIASEVDRIYLNTAGPVEIEDRAFGRRIRNSKEHSQTTVIWNPWIAKAKAMADFADDEWPQMVCIETSNVSPFDVELAPGAEHAMAAAIQVERS